MSIELKEMCKFVRAELKLSQRELGDMINSNQTEVSFIERGFIPSASKVSTLNRLYSSVNFLIEQGEIPNDDREHTLNLLYKMVSELKVEAI